MTAQEILDVHGHRPFPLPAKPWLMRQEWHDLLFAHWALDPALLRKLVPTQLNLDLWRGTAYVAVTPFVIRRLRPRGIPAVPVISHFPEVNVRTYVEFDGVPGVFFFSLDAANLSAVLAARITYRLPYYHAQMRVQKNATDICYESRRSRAGKKAHLRITYSPASNVLAWQPPSESLERFLTERYCLYSVHDGRTYRAHIHHVPWELQEAHARIEVNTMTEPADLLLPQSAPLLHFSRFLDVLVWSPERLV